MALKKSYIIGITAAVLAVAALVVLFASQATPKNVLNQVRASALVSGEETVTIPPEYTVIEAEAFAGIAEFSRVVITGNTEIGEQAFYGCPNLREVVIEGDCEIGDSAFASCPELKEVLITSARTTCADNAFDGHGGVLIRCPSGSRAVEVARLRDISYEIIE